MSAANINDALLSAVKEAHPSCARQLIQAGADVNVITTMGQTALIVAARKGDENCVASLLDLGADVDEAAKWRTFRNQISC